MIDSNRYEALLRYTNLLGHFERVINTKISAPWRTPVWLHSVAIQLRKIENFFVGTIFPQHAEQLSAHTRNGFAVHARAEQLRARDAQLEESLRSFRRKLAQAARAHHPRSSEIRRLRKAGKELLSSLRDHEVEVTTWFGDAHCS